MGRISEDDVARVREATDLVQLVAQSVPLKQKGRLFWGLCPFHGEKTPSMKIDPSTQLWHCFGCGLGGDAFGWVMRLENLEFPDAVRLLAERAHVEIREEAGGMPTGRRERLIAATEAAAEHYHRALTASKDAGAVEARAYLAGRGFGSDVAKRWRLGYAGGGRSALASALAANGFARDELVEANLAMADEGRGGTVLKDRFFNRIMFPITDVSGRTIAFGGRVMGEGQPKYLNTAETPIFHKSANLYGIASAKNEIVRTGSAVVVEGYTDVIALHEAGLRNVVATLGTALTAKHLKLLGRFAKRIVYLFDGDEAGLRAADRAAEFLDASSTPEAGSARIDLAVAVIPEGRDPADHVAAQGADAMQAVVDGAQPLLRFVIDRRLEAHDLGSPEGRAQALEAAVRVLARVRGSILAQDYANYIAGRLLTDYATVMRSLAAAKPDASPVAPTESGGTDAGASTAGREGAVRRRPSVDAQSKAEESLLHALAVVPELREKVRDLLADEDALTDPVTARLSAAVVAAGGATGAELFDAVFRVEPALAAELSGWLVGEADRDAILAVFPETVARIKEFSLRRQIVRLQARMQAADAGADAAASDELFRRVAALTKELQALRSSVE